MHPESDFAEPSNQLANNDSWEDPDNHLLPSTDPERDNEIRYRRLPQEGRVPARLYVFFNLYFIFIFY